MLLTCTSHDEVSISLIREHMRIWKITIIIMWHSFCHAKKATRTILIPIHLFWIVNCEEFAASDFHLCKNFAFFMQTQTRSLLKFLLETF